MKNSFLTIGLFDFESIITDLDHAVNEAILHHTIHHIV